MTEKPGFKTRLARAVVFAVGVLVVSAYGYMILPLVDYWPISELTVMFYEQFHGS